MTKTVEASDSDFGAHVLQSELPVLVDFHAPWCGPCRMLSPFIEELAQAFAGRVKVVKVNVDEAPEIAYQYRITGVPTLMIFRDGNPIDTMVGLGSPRALQARLEAIAPEAVQHGTASVS